MFTCAVKRKIGKAQNWDRRSRRAKVHFAHLHNLRCQQRFSAIAWTEDALPAMTDDESVSAPERDVAAKARDAGCEAVLLPNEDGYGPGTWHFSQKFDEGRFSTAFHSANLQRDQMETTEMALGGTEGKFQPGNLQQKEFQQTTCECGNIFEDCTS
jgi:hypothetical protein